MQWGCWELGIEQHIAPVNDDETVAESHVFDDACWCDYRIEITKLNTILVIHESQSVIVKDSNLNIV